MLRLTTRLIRAGRRGSLDLLVRSKEAGFTERFATQFKEKKNYRVLAATERDICSKRTQPQAMVEASLQASPPRSLLQRGRVPLLLLLPL